MWESTGALPAGGSAFSPSTTRFGAMDDDLLSIAANEVQHDAVLDYYGRRLATCSSDKTIKIFEVEGEKHTLIETLRGYVTVHATGVYQTLTGWQTRRRRLVRSMGTSQVRQHPRLLFLRRQGPHLARTVKHLAEDLRGRHTHGFRQPRFLGPS
jgi:hypothetical protein